MAVISPIALATKGKVCDGRIEPIALATLGVLCVASGAAPAVVTVSGRGFFAVGLQGGLGRR